MNTRLETLFEQYNLSQKDRYEINQFFELLPIDKKHNLLNNFELIVIKIKKIQEDMRIEQEILMWDAISKIKNAINIAKEKQFLN